MARSAIFSISVGVNPTRRPLIASLAAGSGLGIAGDSLGPTRTSSLPNSAHPAASAVRAQMRFAKMIIGSIHSRWTEPINAGPNAWIVEPGHITEV